MNKAKQVSVVIPVRNEENHIKKCIESILKQDYTNEKLEVIFIDGNSEDGTKKIIEQYVNNYPTLITLYDNYKKTAPFAMNIGIKNSKGDYIVRMDAHSEYPSNYISECIKTIENTEADNVGGLVETVGNNFVGKAFAKVLSSKFGVGNSSFRTNSKSRYVDTVPFGTFKKNVFKKIGYYDERLARNQDYELNYRIRKNGGKIYLNSDIKLTYYCRDTLSGIIKQSFDNGKWNLMTTKLCPGTMSLRHFIPLFFLLSLIALPILGRMISIFNIILIVELFAYFLLDFIVSLKICKSISELFVIILFFPLFHLSYGFGLLNGIFSLSKNDNKQ